MSVSQPPVLKKVEKPTDQQSLEMLKSIDSRLEEMTVLKPILPQKKQRSDTGKTHTKKIDQEKVVSDTVEKTVKRIKKEKEVKKEEPKVEEPKVEKKSEKTQSKNFFKNLATRINEFPQKFWDKIDSRFEEDEDFNRQSGEKLTEGVKELSQSTIQGLLGPLNLALDPLAETFGIKFDDLFDNTFKKKGKKVKPKRSDVVKSNPETVWQTDELKKTLGKDSNKTEEMSLMDKLFGGAMAAGGLSAVAKQLFPALLKAAPFAAIAGGLVWAVIDGIKTVGQADNWGVTKVQAFLGGFFSGSGEGWQNVVANAGKWGLTGLGVGMLAGGPIGAIAGLLVGSALGAIFGWIGAENTSQALRDLGYKLGIGTKDSQANASLTEAKTTNKANILTLVSKIVDTKTESGQKALISLQAGLNSELGENEFVKGQEQAIILNEIQKRADKAKTLTSKDQQKEKNKLIEEMNKLKEMFYELKEVKDKGRWSTNIVELQKKYGFDFATVESDKKIEKVNDAIITPAGRIIRPSPDDTIIATKSNVTRGFDSDSMSQELYKLSKSFNDSGSNEIVVAIKELINVVKDKPFNNVVQTNTVQSFDFDKLRMSIA